MILFLSALSALATDVSGPVSGTWAAVDSPFVVVGDVTVDSGDVLFVEPGVRIEYAGHHTFTVAGQLLAEGESAAPIVVTRQAATEESRGSSGLRFDGANAAQSVLSWAVVEWGNADEGVWGGGPESKGGALFIRDSHVLVEHCELRHSSAMAGGGVYIENGSEPVVLRNNVIYGNDSFDYGWNASGGSGVYVYQGGSAVEIYNNLVYDNHSSVSGGNYEGGGGATLHETTAVFAFNTVWGNTSSKGPGLHLLPRYDVGATVWGNVVSGNSGGSHGEQVSVQVAYDPGEPIPSALVVHNNLIDGTMVKVARLDFEEDFVGTDTRAGDPLYEAPESGNFRPLEGSAVVDAADSTGPIAPMTDHHGNDRIDDLDVVNTGAGAAPWTDLGAVEAGYAGCAVDTDLDGVCDDEDGCPFDPDPTQVDTDGDGVGDACDACTGADLSGDADGDGVCARDAFGAVADCDDDDGDIWPGAPERCNGVDDDCDGLAAADEADLDLDGWRLCEFDCDDGADTVHPTAPELCNGVDDDCNGVLASDEADADGDGWRICESDCDDDDPDTWPGAPDSCDGVDSDCAGDIDDELDLDGDGQPVCAGDCDDRHSGVGTGFPEACDGVDSDCDGLVGADEVDADEDGFWACDDCDDGDAWVWPGALEVCDGVDNDCDGIVGAGEEDADADGFGTCAGDCDDAAPSVYPGADEICDGIDNDCDHVLDPGEYDLDGDGVLQCAGDCDDTDPERFVGAVEACNGVDDDCDGEPGLDEIDADGDGAMACAECDDEAPSRNPLVDELCNGIDDNCDGDVDEGCAEVDTVSVSGADGDDRGCSTVGSMGSTWLWLAGLAWCRRLRPAVAGAALLAAPSAAATDISGAVSGTWTSAGSPYVIVGDTEVVSGSSLTIEPGVTVAYDGHYQLVVRGQLLAEGTSDDRITFTRHRPTDDSRGWSNLRFEGASDPSIVSWAIVEHGYAWEGVWGSSLSSSGGGIYIQASDVTVESCVIRDNEATSGGGIFVENQGGVPARIHGNTIHANRTTCYGNNACGGGGIALGSTSETTVISHNVVYDNEYEGSGGNREGGGGLSVHGGWPVVAFNTFWGNQAVKGSGIHIVPATSEAFFSNNLVAGNEGTVNGEQWSIQTGYEPDEPVPDELRMVRNLVGSGGIAKVDREAFLYLVAGENTLLAEPELVAPASGVFRLSGTSPAIDAADATVPGYEWRDFDGMPAVDIAAVPDTGAGYPAWADLGAYEFGSPGCVYDTDSDGVCDGEDLCMQVMDPLQLDTDGDGVGDLCDLCVGDDRSDDDDGDGHCAFAIGGAVQDCDDSDPSVHPGASELCDGSDNDCDGALLADESDLDLDGVRACDGDCDDTRATVYPGAPELCDEIDNDCSGGVGLEEMDSDADGWIACGGDCDDFAAHVYPGAPEICNGSDDDCDGTPALMELDVDADGLAECEGDCDDSDILVYPGALERCNGADDDCDGMLPYDEYDHDEDGIMVCDHDCDDTEPKAGIIGPEVCDGLDNDCDGQVDEECGDGAAELDTGPAPSTGCGCTHGTALSAWAWLGLGILVCRRRE